MEIKRGIPVSEGIVIAQVHLLEQSEFAITRKRIHQKSIDDEIQKFHQAKIKSEQEIEQIKNSLIESGSDEHLAMIFEGHQAILNDPVLYDEIVEKVQNNLFSIEFSITRVFRKYKQFFLDMNNPTFRTKAADFLDIERRLLKNLVGKTTPQTFDTPGILVAHDLTPSQTAVLDRTKITGILTEVGGSTSHSAILAKALGIPAVVGVVEIGSTVTSGDLIILDGTRGSVIILPDENTVKRYENRQLKEIENREKLVEEVSKYQAETFDGEKIKLYANIEFDREIERSLKFNAEGVGLFRTEFIYSLTDGQPTEEEHYQVYKNALKILGPDKPFIIRTMDFGADKFAGELLIGKEDNPFLGLRSIRLSLDPRYTDLFAKQLRAIFRVSVLGNISVMFPMVSSLDELQRIKGLVEDIKEELHKEKVNFDENIKIGIMIEVPSAALIADKLAAEVDFFSIGSNDLVQYTLAVDRNNVHVAHLFEEDHPAVLFLIKKVILAAKKANIPCSLCGEMAGNTRFTSFLIGLGLRIFSMSPASIPMVKKNLHGLKIAETEEFVKKYLDSYNLN